MSSLGDDKAASCTGSHRWRVLLAGSLAHVTHDGFAGMLYLFFPIWQNAFGLNFAQVGFLKTLFSGGMSVFQMPSGIFAGRVGILKVLTGGSILTSLALFGNQPDVVHHGTRLPARPGGHRIEHTAPPVLDRHFQRLRR